MIKSLFYDLYDIWYQVLGMITFAPFFACDAFITSLLYIAVTSSDASFDNNTLVIMSKAAIQPRYYFSDGSSMDSNIVWSFVSEWGWVINIHILNEEKKIINGFANPQGIMASAGYLDLVDSWYMYVGFHAY